MIDELPDPRLRKVYRLEATLGPPLDVGDTARGHRRIVPLTGGAFTGPEINGDLLSGAGVSIGFGGRQAAGVIYETYPVE